MIDPPLLQALTETGAIGSTVRQLAARLDRAPTELAPLLETLAGRGEVLRIGRGLWVLADFARLPEREDFVDPRAFVERFGRENGVALGTFIGPITFSDNRELPVHRWWPYVQGFSAAFVAGVLDAVPLATDATVLDPFAGSGTTLVEARRSGYRAIGSELLPPAALAARVKTHFELEPRVLEHRMRRWLAGPRPSPAGVPPFLRETTGHFLPSVLHELLRLRDRLPPEGDPVSDALRVAFGRVLIPVSRLRRSPCLGYGRPDADVPHDVPEAVRSAVREMEDDLAGLRRERSRWGPRAIVVSGDSRELTLPEGSVDLAVTSPPYVNGMDYVNNYKLDLAWLGYARSYSDLRRLRERLVACDNLGRNAVSSYLTIDEVPDPWLGEILARIRTNVERKSSYRRNDVHGVVKRYFLDLIPVLRAVLHSLRPQGRFYVVVGDSLLAGTYVPGDLLLARLGASVGFRIVGVEVARSRRSGQRRSFELRESVVVLEKPVSAG